MTVPPGVTGNSSTPLDGPPPLPASVSPTAANNGYSGLAPDAEDPQKGAMKGLMDAFTTVDQVLLAAANSLPEGSKEFAAARKLIEQGLAKGLATLGANPPEASPSAAGSQFPGGGFGSVGGLGQ